MAKNEFLCDCNIIHTDIVKDTIPKLESDSLISKVANFYKIIGDETRSKIISILLINPMCVCDLCNILSMTKSSISHQLSKLRDAKIVRSERHGKEIFYYLEDEHVKDIFSLTVTHIKHEEN